MARRVSIRDVAREAGVSVTTVSHALNGKGRLNPETRRRVLEVAEQLGYRPNPAARSLVSGRTGLIAAMASLPSDPKVEFSAFSYYSELIGGATAAAVDRDAALVVAPPSSRGWFVWDRVALDGVIVIDPMVGDTALPVLRDRGSRSSPPAGILSGTPSTRWWRRMTELRHATCSTTSPPEVRRALRSSPSPP